MSVWIKTEYPLWMYVSSWIWSNAIGAVPLADNVYLSIWNMFQKLLLIIICSISKKITKTHMHCTFPALLHFSQFFLNIWQFLVTSYISYTFHVYSLNTLFIFDKKVNWGLFVDTRNMYIYIWPFRWLRAKNYNV